jgi:hypothetical protein
MTILRAQLEEAEEYITLLEDQLLHTENGTARDGTAISTAGTDPHRGDLQVMISHEIEGIDSERDQSVTDISLNSIDFSDEGKPSFTESYGYKEGKKNSSGSSSTSIRGSSGKGVEIEMNPLHRHANNSNNRDRNRDKNSSGSDANTDANATGGTKEEGRLLTLSRVHLQAKRGDLVILVGQVNTLFPPHLHSLLILFFRNNYE